MVRRAGHFRRVLRLGRLGLVNRLFAWFGRAEPHEVVITTLTWIWTVLFVTGPISRGPFIHIVEAPRWLLVSVSMSVAIGLTLSTTRLITCRLRRNVLLYCSVVWLFTGAEMVMDGPRYFSGWSTMACAWLPWWSWIQTGRCD